MIVLHLLFSSFFPLSFESRHDKKCKMGLISEKRWREKGQTWKVKDMTEREKEPKENKERSCVVTDVCSAS